MGLRGVNSRGGKSGFKRQKSAKKGIVLNFVTMATAKLTPNRVNKTIFFCQKQL